MITKTLTKEELALSEQKAATAARHIKSHNRQETIKESIASAKKVKENLQWIPNRESWHKQMTI